MKQLIQGLQKYREDYVSSHWDLLDQLAHGQSPRVLFITCSDSRIVPSLLTQTDPGELFVIRNAGNIIPPYGAANGGEGATLEYAIHALGIDQIIVCGHSHCGAMKGLLKLNQLQEDLPLVYDWLKHTEATRRLLKENYSHYGKEELLEIAIAENVLTQIENLKTYPVVHSRLYQGKLDIYGWIYLIETGEVLAYDPESRTYISPQSQLAGDYTPGSYTTTSAPPVACEIPLRPGSFPSPVVPDRPPAPVTPDRPPAPVVAVVRDRPNTSNVVDYSAWLSPEQADRIYRGTAARRSR